jgi:hypothetical protein
MRRDPGRISRLRGAPMETQSTGKYHPTLGAERSFLKRRAIVFDCEMVIVEG